MQNELYHHGILGQKWGVRRFQNKDGSLTPAGRKRYNVNIDEAKARIKSANKELYNAQQKYNMVSSYGGAQSLNAQKAYKDYERAKEKVDWEKSKLSDEKAKAAMNKEKGEKSRHRLELEQHYREKGMSAEEAEIAAYKRARTEKALAVIGGVTVAAAAAYVGYKYWDKNVDKMIKPGTLLQNISNNSNKGVEDAFYASLNRADNNKYRGLYGMERLTNGKVYESKFKVNNGLKVASEKNARKILGDMVNDGTLSKSELSRRFELYREGMEKGSKQGKLLNKAIKSLDNGSIDKNVYDAFNLTLPYNQYYPELNDGTKKFYNTLTSKGYDAIIDVNDKRYSGYRSKNPIIAFNAAGKTAVSSSREVGEGEIVKQYFKSRSALETRVPYIGAGVGMTAGAGIAAVSNTYTAKKQRDKIVANYKREHPNTQKSYNEILDMYYEK